MQQENQYSSGCLERLIGNNPAGHYHQTQSRRFVNLAHFPPSYDGGALDGEAPQFVSAVALRS